MLAGEVGGGGGGGGEGGIGGGGSNNPSREPRNLTLTNTFPCPVVIYNLTLPDEARAHFEVSRERERERERERDNHVYYIDINLYSLDIYVIS